MFGNKEEKIINVGNLKNEVKHLKNLIEDLYKKYGDLQEELYKTKRIVAYSEDKPTCRLEKFYDRSECLYPVSVHKAFMYIDGEEYSIVLHELLGYVVFVKFEVINGLGYLEAMNSDYHYNFVIDYKHNKYVCTLSEKMATVTVDQKETRNE